MKWPVSAAAVVRLPDPTGRTQSQATYHPTNQKGARRRLSIARKVATVNPLAGRALAELGPLLRR